MAKVVAEAHLARARSTITVSFDGWKADNDLDLLGVLAHYLDQDLKPRTILLGMRETFGCHSGENIAEHLLTVLREFKITNRVGYFVADNASNNDRALRLMAEQVTLQPTRQRLRCTGHVLNLICKAVLHGVDSDCIADAYRESDDLEDSPALMRFEGAMRSKDEATQLRAWRRQGAIGRLHNLVVHIRRSPARRQFFESKQREAMPDREVYRMVLNGGVRWNSTHDMIVRGLKLRDAVELYQAHYASRADSEHLPPEDCLRPEDWRELVLLDGLLQPIQKMSMMVQGGSGPGSRNGVLWQALTSLDWLLTKFEDLKHKHNDVEEKAHFNAYINLGWKKLNKYYELTDDTPAYRLAIFLHPSFKMAWFERRWRDRQTWIEDVRRVVRDSYETAKRRWPDEQRSASKDSNKEELDEFEQHNTVLEQPDDDEVQQWISEPLAALNTDPLKWWSENHHRYPVLRHMAFEMLATPASSAGAERVFSLAGNVVNDERYGTRSDLAEAYQCLKNWYCNDIV